MHSEHMVQHFNALPDSRLNHSVELSHILFWLKAKG